MLCLSVVLDVTQHAGNLKFNLEREMKQNKKKMRHK